MEDPTVPSIMIPPRMCTGSSIHPLNRPLYSVSLSMDKLNLSVAQQAALIQDMTNNLTTQSEKLSLDIENFKNWSNTSATTFENIFNRQGRQNEILAEQLMEMKLKNQILELNARKTHVKMRSAGTAFKKHLGTGLKNFGHVTTNKFRSMKVLFNRVCTLKQKTPATNDTQDLRLNDLRFNDLRFNDLRLTEEYASSEVKGSQSSQRLEENKEGSQNSNFKVDSEVDSGFNLESTLELESTSEDPSDAVFLQTICDMYAT